MKKSLFLSVFLLLIAAVIANSQTTPATQKAAVNQKARYLKEDLKAFLTRNTLYPREGLSNNIEGDVVLSFVINKEGRMDSLTIENSADNSLAVSAVTAFTKVSDHEWSPARVNDQPVDQKYKVVFRFRQFFDTEPYDYKAQAWRLFDKEKYEKALKVYNEGIEDNQYDVAMFEERSRVKKILGDTEGSQLDHAIAAALKEEIMTVVNINAVARTRVVQTKVITTTPVSRY